MNIDEQFITEKEKALMIIIHKMIARYQNVHYTNLDEGIFVLFERAKCIHRAEEFLTIKTALE